MMFGGTRGNTICSKRPLREFGVRIISLLLVVAILGGCDSNRQSVESNNSNVSTLGKPIPDDKAGHIDAMIARGQFSEAQQQLREWMIVEPENVLLIKTLAYVQGKSGQPELAARTLAQAVTSGATDTSLVELAVQSLMQVGQLFEAVDVSRFAVEAQPENMPFRRTLVGLLGEAQQLEEIPEHLQVLIQRRQFDAMLLETVAIPGRRFSTETIRILLERNPDDLRLRLGEAAHHVDLAKYDSAIAVLDEIVQHHPDFEPAFGLLARCLAMIDDNERVQKLIETTSQPIDNGDWNFAVGRNQQARGEIGAAIGSYWKSLQQKPNELGTIAALSLAMTSLDDLDSDAKYQSLIQQARDSLSRRFQGLSTLNQEVRDFSYAGRDDPNQAMAIAESLIHLGRNWEAEAWSAIAIQLQRPNAASPEPVEGGLNERRNRVVRRLQRSPEWQEPLPGRMPALDQVVRSFVGSTKLATGRPSERHVISQGATFAFRNEAQERGVTYHGHTGSGRFGPAVPLADSLGCGAGTFDFDRDGHVDILLTSAGGSVGKRDSRAGALLRGLGETFLDVTDVANSGDAGYGQGIAIDDVNQDGFFDIYWLNFGENRYLRNNGDGTFTDATSAVGFDVGNGWSTSGAWIDLNADGLMDLVVCNYIDDTKGVSQTKQGDAGRAVSDSPLNYAAATNQIFVGRADGTWIDASERFDVDPKPGRSLGIVAGRLDGENVSLLIANDMSENQFLTFEPKLGDSDDDVTPIRIADRSFLSSLALDGRGRPQASMGIAAEDFDHDGAIDLLVTGFADEYNILYRQAARGVWADVSHAAELVTSSLDQVGFGTVAIDVDNDSFAELFVTNGHISDIEPSGVGYAQAAQLYRQTTLMKFVSTTVQSPDGYWADKHVGRCVIPLDVNSDGRCDLLVTHVTQPPALLINETVTPYGSCTLELVGIQSTRTPVGTIVRFSPDTPTHSFEQTKQLLAGNGYMISQEPRLRFAFGEAAITRSVSVEWPDGTRQSIGPLRPGHHYLCIEGQPLHCFNAEP